MILKISSILRVYLRVLFLLERHILEAFGRLKHVLGSALLTYEDFNTVLVQIKECLNSRPLCPLSGDRNDPSPLTYSHFFDDRKDVGHTRRLQKLLQHFWKRWSCDYLAELQTRTRWKQKRKGLLRPGVLVLVKEDGWLLWK